MSTSLEIADGVIVDYPFEDTSGFYRNQYQSVVEGRYVPQRWRITGFYKRYVKPLPRNKKEDFMSKLLKEIELDRLSEMSVKKQLEEKFKCKLIACSKEEAQYVGLYSICGAIVPIEWVVFDSKIGWTDEQIEQEKESWNRRVRCEDDYIKMVDKHTDPRYMPYVKMLWGGVEGDERMDTVEYYYYDAWVQKYDGRKYFEIGRDED